MQRRRTAKQKQDDSRQKTAPLLCAQRAHRESNGRGQTMENTAEANFLAVRRIRTCLQPRVDSLLKLSVKIHDLKIRLLSGAQE